jgi:hypothetical protein
MFKRGGYTMTKWQYSYLMGFYEEKILKFTLWINGAIDSIQAENTARKMCNDKYYVKELARE